MKDGSWVIGLFNRDQAAATRSIDLTKVGITGTWSARDLWSMLMKVL